MKKRALSLIICVCMILTLLPALGVTALAEESVTAPKMKDPTESVTLVYHDLSTMDGSYDVPNDGKMHIFYGKSDGKRINLKGGEKDKPVYISLNGVDMYKQQSPISVEPDAYAQVWLNFSNSQGRYGDNILRGGSDTLISWDYYGYAGLHVAENAHFALRFKDELCKKEARTLTCYGGMGAAGIGADDNDNTCSSGCWLDIDVSTNYNTIYAYGGFGGAGVGAGRDGWCQNVFISRGTVKAYGGASAAGIGAGKSEGEGNGGKCYEVVITGGNITATGGGGGAGIGAGEEGDAGKGDDGKIWIQNAVVHAYGGTGAAGIGGGDGLAVIGGGNAEKITITKDAKVYAYGSSGGAGVGGGRDGDAYKITIDNATVCAYSDSDAAAIGAGNTSNADTITILNNSSVTAIAKGSGAGIGSGGSSSLDMTADAYHIYISGSSVYAESYSHGAGIGGGRASDLNSNISDIKITNSVVTAHSDYGGAGIGGGMGASGCDIYIEHSTVTATSDGENTSSREENGGAGIGGGAAGLNDRGSGINITIKYSSVTGSSIGGGGGNVLKYATESDKASGKNITIENSSVNVTGNYGCAGIGGGYNGNGENITIWNSDVKATSGEGGGAGIGGGGYNAANVFMNVDAGGIWIKDSDITAKARDGGAGIGGGSGGAGGVILEGGSISAESGTGGAVGNGINAASFHGKLRVGGVEIKRGTMCFNDLGKDAGDFPASAVISGGSINVRNINGQVWNSTGGGQEVYKTTIELPYGKSDAGKAVNNLKTNVSGFCAEGIYGDEEGKIYLWLPEDTEYTEDSPLTLQISGNSSTFKYKGKVSSGNNTILELINPDAKKTETKIVILCEDKVEDGSPVVPHINTNLFEDIDEIVLTYKDITDPTNPTTLDKAPSAVGNYSVTGYFAGNEFYTECTSDPTYFEIFAKPKPPTPPEPPPESLVIECASKVYDKQPATITVVSQPEGAINYTHYKWNGTSYDELTNAPTDAGQYKVQGHIDAVSSNEVVYRVFKAIPSVPTPTAYLKQLTSALKLSDFLLPGTWEWLNGEREFNSVGKFRAVAKYTPSDTTNYFFGYAMVEIIVTPPKNMGLKAHDWTVSMQTANSSEGVKEWVENEIETQRLITVDPSSTVTYTVTMVTKRFAYLNNEGFVPACAQTCEHIVGSDGHFDFLVMLKLDGTDYSQPVLVKTGKIAKTVDVPDDSWKELWDYDSTAHMHKCPRCDYFSDKSPHTMGEGVNYRSWRVQKCSVCNYHKVSVIPEPDEPGGGGVSTVTVTALATGRGEISPAGEVKVIQLSDKTFTLTPEKNHALSDLLLDGKSVLAEAESGKYTLKRALNNCTLEAVFKWVNPFEDVKSADWFYGGVESVCSDGYMEGTSKVTFSPALNMTREMLWAVLARKNGETITGESWAQQAKSWVTANGISDGANADKEITREQLSVMLWRYAERFGLTLKTTDADAAAFSDYALVSPWAREGVIWAVSSGIIVGTTATTLNPQGLATRAEVATMFQRFCVNVMK